MELISVVFPSGPVKVFDFLSFPASHSHPALSSSFLTLAYQELIHNQLLEHPWLLLRVVITSSQWLKSLCQNQRHPLLLVSHCVPPEFHLPASFLLISSLFQLDVMKRKKGAPKVNIRAAALFSVVTDLLLLEADDVWWWKCCAPEVDLVFSADGKSFKSTQNWTL